MDGGSRYDGICGRWCLPKTARDVLHDAARDLPLAHDDEVRAELRQVFDLLIGMRARYDLQVGISRTCLLDKIAVFKWVRDCADELPGTSQVCGLQEPQLSRIARDGFNASGAELSTISLRSSITKNGWRLVSIASTTRLPTRPQPTITA